MDLPRSVLVALLERLEADPDLCERARRVLRVDVAPARNAYVSRADARRTGRVLDALDHVGAVLVKNVA